MNILYAFPGLNEGAEAVVRLAVSQSGRDNVLCLLN